MDNTKKKECIEYLDKLWLHYDKQAKIFSGLSEKEYWKCIDKKAAISEVMNIIGVVTI